MQRRTLAALAAALCAGATGTALAQAPAAPGTGQGAYPNRSIRLLVGYSPAGAADLIARIVGEAMSKRLGQSLVVDNKPGAGSTLASSLLANAPADGYTLGLATGTLYGIDQYLYKVKYKPGDFTPLMRLTVSPLVLAVNPKLPAKTTAELAAYAKAHPGKLNYSSSGIGGSPHMGALIFEKAVGTTMQHIPYKGGAPALQAVAAGDVDLSFGTAASVLPLGQAGTVRMLGVSTPQPSAVAPGLPTIAETGLPGFDFSFWFGLFAPANLPKDVEAKLYAAVSESLADPEVKAKLLSTGNEAAPLPSSAAFLQWATGNGRMVLERVEAAGVKVE